jgi:hypothetical protein
MWPQVEQMEAEMQVGWLARQNVQIKGQLCIGFS